jgi:DNA-binding protein YbaB
MHGTLGPSDDVEVEQLRREGERLTRLLRLPDASATYEGHDPTKTVHIVLNGAGVVTDVRIARSWRTTVDYRKFGTVVLEALAAADRAQSAAFQDYFAENERAQAAAPIEEEPPPRRTRRHPEPEPARPADSRPPQVFLKNLVTLLGQAEVELRNNGAPAPAATTGQSPGGHVTVALNGNRVTGVELDRRWLNVASNMEIAGELRGAFTAAYAAAKAARPAVGGRLTELNALLAKPDELIADLFGTNR